MSTSPIPAEPFIVNGSPTHVVKPWSPPRPGLYLLLVCAAAGDPSVPRSTGHAPSRPNSRVVIHHHGGQLVVGQVDTHDRILHRQLHAHPGEPVVAVAITPGQRSTVDHRRLLDEWDAKPDGPHQEDVSTSSTDALHALLEDFAHYSAVLLTGLQVVAYC